MRSRFIGPVPATVFAAVLAVGLGATVASAQVSRSCAMAAQAGIAVPECQAAAKLEPREAGASAQIARSCAMAAQAGIVVPACQAAAKPEPREAGASAQIARSCAMAARAGIAVPECQAAAKPKPREIGAELAVPELGTPPRFSDPFGNAFPSEWSEKGVKAYLAGDVDTALAEVDRLEDYVEGDFQRWRLRLVRVDMMMMAGRAADAEPTLVDAARRETALFGRAVVTPALAGQAKALLGEYEAAIAEFDAVLDALQGWTLPTEYTAAPSEPRRLMVDGEASIRARMGLASAHYMAGNYAMALKWAEEAERRFDDFFYVKDHPVDGAGVPELFEFYVGRAINLATYAAASLIVIGDEARSERFFAAASRFFAAGRFVNGAVEVAAMRASAYLESGRVERGLVLTERASALAAEKGNHEIVWRLEARLGRALLDAERKEEAERALRRAQAAINLTTGALVTDRAKRRFGTGKDDVSYYLARLDFEKGDPAALYRDLEQGRARAFVDLLSGQPLAEGRQVERVAAIRALDRRILSAGLRRSFGAGGADAGGDEVGALLEARRAAVAELRVHDADLADLLSVAAPSLEAVQARLGANETLLYALPARENDALRFLAVGAGSTRLSERRVTSGELGDLIEDFTDAIALEQPEAQRRHAKRLSEALGVSTWARAGPVYVVPSGWLYFVPWGALDIAVPVAVLPMGGWIARTVSAGQAPNPAAVVGDPAYGGQMPQLPGARAEAAAIGQQYRVTPLVGAEATEAGLRDAIADGVGVLHVAAHATFDRGQPLRSAIFLSRDGGAAPLSAARLFEAPLKARLVVLSACETGVGEVAAGDDYLGLLRSFYLGGAVATLSSLWPVDDEATRIFMERFHDRARSGEYGPAWLAARDALIEAGFPPGAYGAFALGGALRDSAGAGAERS